jgi:surface carbohydrate biosynthesis protein (TIGR04326 family)
MPKQVLLVLTNTTPQHLVLNKLIEERIEKVYLCPIERGAEAVAANLKLIISQKTQIKVEDVSFLERFNEEAFQLKSVYLKFIYDLGETKVFSSSNNLKEYFKYPSEQFSLWWFSLLNDKSPYKTNSFTLFVKIITLLRLKNELQCQQLWGKNEGSVMQVLKTIQDPSFAFLSPQSQLKKRIEDAVLFIREMLRTMKFFFIFLKQILDVKFLFNHSSKKALQTDVTILTAFPFLNYEQLKAGKYFNSLFGSLQNSIEQHGKKILWLGMYHSSEGHDWTKALKLASQVKKHDQLILLEEWMNVGIFLRILWRYFQVVTKYLLKKNHFSSCFMFKEPETGVQFNVWSVFKQDFLSSFLGKDLLSSIANYELFKECMKHLPKNNIILYFAEMHGWEKAVNLAVGKRKDLKCIGIQHTIVPILYLSYFNHPLDFENNDFLRSTPRPNYLGCVGKTTKNMLNENKYPQKELFVLGGFRFNDFILSAKNEIKLSAEKAVVVALSYDKEENEEILWLLSKAFDGKDVDYKILIKSHPCCPAEELVKNNRLYFNPKYFAFTGSSLNEIVPRSQAMIVKASSAAFWALRYKIPVVVPNLYNIVDLCPLTGISKLAQYINRPDDLFMSVSEIMAGKKQVDPKAYEDFLSEYLEVYSDNKQYYDNINKFLM